jgi:hypothetical protein
MQVNFARKVPPHCHSQWHERKQPLDHQVVVRAVFVSCDPAGNGTFILSGLKSILCNKQIRLVTELVVNQS